MQFVNEQFYETNMIASNTKGDENPTEVCEHGVPSDR